MSVTVNQFKRNLGVKQQLGTFSTLASPAVAEMLAQCGFDWILVDTEHSPNELPVVVDHLRAIAGCGISPLVRPAWADMVLVKRLLDAGAQTLLFPYVQNAEEARRAVSYTRFPPDGVRGVSGSSRAAGYGLVPDYFKNVAKEICVLVQIETADALEQLEDIASVDGVDAVFIGPADLAASFGHLGNPQHPDVQQAIDKAFERLRAIGKPSGYLTGNWDEAQRRIRQGVDFVSLGTDTVIASRAAKELVATIRKACSL
ncbi:MAG: 4-hydroxy-2-oxo-heptane-1,7-dioate aldolase [Proteobacteria bacterium]|nr:4-hydroxy-2-oxo-heptane-1,7-dioate aldolase [Pseudomonadota bacterium]